MNHLLENFSLSRTPYALKQILVSLLLLLLATGCHAVEKEAPPLSFSIDQITSSDLLNSYPNTVFYEIFVRSFYDSNNDGIGDINGMTDKLDYLKDLGIEGIWLMPVNPSPSYHGYDITNYLDIDSEYGTLDDFKTFLKAAHERNMKVIMDLVVNHTSIEHPWFQDAISSPDSPYRDWYIWADETTNLRERGEWGQPFWHGKAPNQYMSVFWSGMPDLNFDNPEVREEMIRIGHFWLELGVDGFRLDAAKHLFPKEKEKNLVWWKEFRQAMEEVKKDVFLVGEVWDLPQVAAPYLEAGLHSTFHFDLAEDILQAARAERGGSLVTKLIRSLSIFEQYSDEFVDATFITNHDMNRVMSELSGNVDRAKMAAALLLTLPGSPFVYYGEEIGMSGQKPDEHIREPMRWYEAGSNGQTSWIAPKHDTGPDAPSVEEQWKQPNSLLEHYRTLIYLRRSQPVLLYGDIVETSIREQGIVSFIRSHDEDEFLVIHNLSKNEMTIMIDEEFKNVFFTSIDQYIFDNQTLTLPPYTTFLLSK